VVGVVVRVVEVAAVVVIVVGVTPAELGAI